MGSKARFAKNILKIILKERKIEQWYVEPFSGGMNIIDKVGGRRIANDIHTNLIEMWKALVLNNWIPPYYTKEEYKHIKYNRKNYSPHVVGWVGFNLSYCGKYFGGYTGKAETNIGIIKDYQIAARNNIKKQIRKLKDVIFKNEKYYNLKIPANSVIYCDPPYKNTTGYSNKFNHDFFWNWCRTLSKMGHEVWISEYNAPKDFECIWSKEVTILLNSKRLPGERKVSTEKLFKYKY